MRLQDGWEAEATNWAAWTRTPGHDDSWTFNWPAFTTLLPPPGKATLDVGCGEGRGGRWLAEHGHRVTGVDASPTLAAMAREGGGYVEVVAADAAALPFDPACFDLVVAFMCLQDVDDLDGAVDEAARVLEPGGRLCIAILHPMQSADLGVNEVRYFDERQYCAVIERDGLRMPFHSRHRTLEAFTGALRASGFVIEDLREPMPSPEQVREVPRREYATLRPIFLHLLAVRKP